MYYWRFLILAFLAALHPISSFSELNSVDGREQCCDEGPTSLLQETKLSYGSLWQTSKDNRLNLNRDISKNRRHELNLSVVRRSTEDRRITDRRSEGDNRRVLRIPVRLARDDMRSAEARDRRQREFTTVERDDHRITSRDISRLERDRVRNSRTVFTRASNERNKISTESRRESRNPDSRSEFRNKENRETRNLLERARDDVVFGGRIDHQFRQTRLSRLPERHPHRAREGMEKHHEIFQNELKSRRERDSIMNQRMSRSFETRDQRIRARTEPRHELSRNEFRWNTERDSAHRMSQSLERRDHTARERMEMRKKLSPNSRFNRERNSTLRISRSLERRPIDDHRVRDRAEARDEFPRSDLMSGIDDSQDYVSRASRESINKRRGLDFSPRLRVTDHTNQRIAREKRSMERLSSESRYQARDLEQRQAAEMFNERGVLQSQQVTRARVETRSDSRAMNVNSRRVTKEMENNLIQRSRSESRKMDQQLSGQNDHRIHEKDFRSRSVHRDINRELQHVNSRKNERDFTNPDHDERRIARIVTRNFLDEKRQQSVDRRQMERNSVDRNLMTRSEFRLQIRRSLGGNRERNVINRIRETRDTKINPRGVWKSFEEHRLLTLDRRERDLADSVRNEKSESRLNHEQRDRQVSRTIRNNQESWQQSSGDSVERLRNIPLELRDVRRSFGYDNRESRAFEKRVRTISAPLLVERPKERQIFRDFNRDVRINTRTENRNTRNLERENYRFRSDVRYAENRDSFVLPYKTQDVDNISTLNWQYLFYTLQVIYLCSIFANVFTNDETGKKTKSTPWWTGRSQILVKLD